MDVDPACHNSTRLQTAVLEYKHTVMYGLGRKGTMMDRFLLEKGLWYQNYGCFIENKCLCCRDVDMVTGCVNKSSIDNWSVIVKTLLSLFASKSSNLPSAIPV